MPDHFFIVGAQRSGTTLLYSYLAEHPEIEMARPARPEPKFFLFDTLYEQGLDHYYQTFFEAPDSGRLLGEKSTSYIESAKVAQRIMRDLPNAKIVMSLRDPVERAISNYWFSYNNGIETLPLDEAIYQEESRREHYDHQRISASPYAYLQRGHYMHYIDVYLQHVPREQIKLLIYEQLPTDPAAVQSLLDFLGVSPLDIPFGREVVNQSVKQETVVPPALRQYMIDHFAASNQRLADFLKLDLEPLWAH
jgi:hypothetical protein